MSGGVGNTASASEFSVSGGFRNPASGQFSSILGGDHITVADVSGAYPAGA